MYASQRVVSKGNVAAVEPFIHTPQKAASSITITKKQSQEYTQPFIQDFVNTHQTNDADDNNKNINHVHAAECDESKLARQRIIHTKQPSQDIDVISDITDFATMKYSPDPKNLTTSTYHSTSMAGTKKTSDGLVKMSATTYPDQQKVLESNDSDSAKADIEAMANNCKKQSNRQREQSAAVKAIKKSNSSDTATSALDSDSRQMSVPYVKQQMPWSNLVVPPRKPISCVAPTNISHATNPRVLAVAPNINKVHASSTNQNEKPTPALPPKPNKITQNDTSPPQSNASSTLSGSKPIPDKDQQRISIIGRMPTLLNAMNKPTTNEATVERQPAFQHSTSQLNVDNLPIKAKPLTIRKQPLSEQPRLRSMPSNLKNVQYGSRRIEMPPAFLFPEVDEAPLKSDDGNSSSLSDIRQQLSGDRSNSTDDTDKSTDSSVSGDEKPPNVNFTHNDIARRPRSSLSDNNKVKLTRRVSFDPLALLLDASLEGELELVKKTAIQVNITMHVI